MQTKWKIGEIREMGRWKLGSVAEKATELMKMLPACVIYSVFFIVFYYSDVLCFPMTCRKV